MGFGLSGNPNRTQMVGADAVIAYVDNNQGAFAIDYSLTAQTQVHTPYCMVHTHTHTNILIHALEGYNSHPVCLSVTL